jgi:hypothetical protein
MRGHPKTASTQGRQTGRLTMADAPGRSLENQPFRKPSFPQGPPVARAVLTSGRPVLRRKWKT